MALDNQVRDEKTIKQELAVLQKDLAKVEVVLMKSRKITSEIKYENVANSIISQIKSLVSKDLKIDHNELESAEQEVSEARQQLESAVYGLDNVFADAHRSLQLSVSDLENELAEIEYNKKYSRQPTTESSTKKKSNIGGALGDDSTSVISGRNKICKTTKQPNQFGLGETEEKTMNDDLSTESLRYLAGLKKTIAECGMMPSPAGSQTPASINITASSGAEVSSMLKDIMSLAGVHQVGQEDMPVIAANQTAGMPKKSSCGEPSMKDMLAVVDKPDAEMDTMNRSPAVEKGVEESPEYDNSPSEKMHQDPIRQHGDIDNNMQNALVAKPVDKARTAESLYAEYQSYVAENKRILEAKKEKAAKAGSDIGKPGKGRTKDVTDSGKSSSEK
jgi:hypothetical protein